MSPSPVRGDFLSTTHGDPFDRYVLELGFSSPFETPTPFMEGVLVPGVVTNTTSFFYQIVPLSFLSLFVNPSRLRSSSLWM